MEPLRVRAHLANSFSAADPWSPSLDGILAYYQLRERLGEEEFALGMTGHRPLVTPDDLPLERVTWGEQWWWATSAPIVAVAARYTRHFHRRFDADQAERYLDPRVRRVQVSAGPYKAYRHARTHTVTRQIVWHCIGDGAEIRRLLRLCTAVGFGRGQGYGTVTGWTVTAEGADETLARFWRPLPADYAAAHGVDGPRLAWGIRPPGRMPENRTLCVMPVAVDEGDL